MSCRMNLKKLQHVILEISTWQVCSSHVLFPEGHVSPRNLHIMKLGKGVLASSQFFASFTNCLSVCLSAHLPASLLPCLSVCRSMKVCQAVWLNNYVYVCQRFLSLCVSDSQWFFFSSSLALSMGWDWVCNIIKQASHNSKWAYFSKLTVRQSKQEAVFLKANLNTFFFFSFLICNF